MAWQSEIDQIIDGHAHPILNQPQVSLREFAFAFSESDDPHLLDEHAPNTVTMAAGVRYLAKRLGVEPTPEALVAYRNQVGLAPYAQQLVAGENIRCIFLDSGYPTNGLSVGDCETILGTTCKEVVRVETLAETLLPQATSFDDLMDELERSLRAIDIGRVVAFKSIASYRCGMDLDPGEPADQAAAFDEARRQLDENGVVRIAAKPLVTNIVERTLHVAGDLELPLQLHTGFGDRDLALPKSNPWLMQPLLDDPRFADVPLIFLHCGYPFVRDTSLLATLYRNVYVDLSLAIPLTAHGGSKIVMELLEQIPASKLMYGSDASCSPELFAWGAFVGRRAVDAALGSLTEGDWLTCDEAHHFAHLIFAENARRLYRHASI